MAATQAKMGPFHIIVRPVPRLFIMTSISKRRQTTFRIELGESNKKKTAL